MSWAVTFNKSNKSKKQKHIIFIWIKLHLEVGSWPVVKDTLDFDWLEQDIDNKQSLDGVGFWLNTIQLVTRPNIMPWTRSIALERNEQLQNDLEWLG